MKKLEKPNMEIVRFDTDDVVVASGSCSGYCSEVCEGVCERVCEPKCMPNCNPYVL